MMTIETESDVLVCVKYAIWLVLSSTCHFLTDNSLQSADKDQQESCAVTAVAEKLHDAVVKFDMYRNLQQYRAVLPATGRQHGIL